ncbi:MAG: UvrD-helicase domain-containing protein [Polyangiaceae bacterium]|nr:UvrD-helicase domain-containing protein [Polyangiaceae bacterium]
MDRSFERESQLETQLGPLNEPQLEAVTHSSGPLLVLAGAGSGKTRVITYRIANLIATHRVPPHKIYAVTFTNKAAREMKTRIEKLAGYELTRDLWIGTFHATCARLLRKYHQCVGLQKDFIIYDDADQSALMTQSIESLDISTEVYPAKLAISILHKRKQQDTNLKNTYIEKTCQEHLSDPTTTRILAEYQRRLLLANAVDFDDLIIHIVNIAEDPQSTPGAELRTRFQHILVDEFQDVNQVQYRLIKALATNSHSICVVGDDDQSIYRWRGADVRIIRGFKHHFPGTQTIKLEENYRSSSNIVRAALAIISSSREREPKQLFTENPAGRPIRIIQTETERNEASTVARAIDAAIINGIRRSEIAVFYRVHAQSRVLEEAMRTFNIPYQIVGGTRFFDRKEIKDILAYLRVIINPASDVDILRIINTPPRQIGQATITSITQHANLNNKSISEVISSNLRTVGLKPAPIKRARAFANMIEFLRTQAATLNPRNLAEEVLHTTGYRSHLQSDESPESQARLQNIDEFLGSISEYEKNATIQGLDPSLIGYLEQVSLVSSTDQSQDTECISMMTVHAAKGLEFDTVFITGFEDGLFPFNPHQSDGDIEEERRLAYVAVTRARSQLTITHAKLRSLFGRTFYNKASNFLANIPHDVLTPRIQSVTSQLSDRNQSATTNATAQYSDYAGSVPAKPDRKPGEIFVEYDEPNPPDDDAYNQAEYEDT